MTDCGWCGRPRARVQLPHARICQGCRRRRAYHPGVCPGCDQRRPLAYRDADGNETCAACAGAESVFACNQCGREDHPYGGRRCARCILAERLTVLLTDPSTGQVHQRLRPVLDELVAGHRPQTTIYWLLRKPGHGPALLRQMATGQAAISHETFTSLPMDKARNYLRDLLTAVGVLPPFEPRIERIEPWLAQLVQPLTPDDARAVEQFARWSTLRRLRDAADQDRLTKNMIWNARHALREITTFLAWLEDQPVALADARQPVLEDFLEQRPSSTVTALVPFIRWLNKTHTNHHLRLAFLTPIAATVTMSDQDRWTHVSRLLHDDTIKLYARIAGLFVLLFAQSMTSICTLRADQVQTRDDGVFVTFRDTAIEMPDQIADLLRAQLAHRASMFYAATTNPWLFPGRHPGRHLATENIRRELTTAGIRGINAKHAALFSLAAEVPHMILAQTLSIGQTSATRWAALAARDWGAYLSARNE